MKGIYNRIFTGIFILVLLCTLTGCAAASDSEDNIRRQTGGTLSENGDDEGDDDSDGTRDFGTYTVCIGSTDEKNDYIGTWYGDRYNMIISAERVIMTDNGEVVINTSLQSDDGFLYFDDYMYHTNSEEPYGYVGEVQLLDEILTIYVTDRESGTSWTEHELNR